MNAVETSWNYEIGVCHCGVTVDIRLHSGVSVDLSLSQWCYCRFEAVTAALL
jgi:phenolic acid decarboxylase